MRALRLMRAEPTPADAERMRAVLLARARDVQQRAWIATAGRFADRPSTVDSYPVALLASWPLTDLPDHDHLETMTEEE